MNKVLNEISKIKNQRGVTAIVTAAVMVMLIGFIALAVDVGYLYATRNELQNVADAAALAGARQLGAIYETMSYDEQQSYVCDPTSSPDSSILSTVQDVSGKNKAAGKFITINDVKIGRWDSETRSFSENLSQPDAVWVKAARKEGANGSIGTFFARIFGIDSVDVEADATAALTGQLIASPGEVELPVGISKTKFPGGEDWCGDIIKFSPPTDPDACAGWTNFQLGNVSDGWGPSGLRTLLTGMLNGTMESQELIANNDSVGYTNGVLSAQTFDAMLTLFQHNGYDVGYDHNNELVPRVDTNGDPVAPGIPLEAVGDAIPMFDTDGVTQLTYPDGAPRYEHRWLTTVLVYDSPTCTPNEDIEIEGFAEVEVFDVGNPPDKTILAKIKCNYVEHSRGGGGSFGKKGSIPGLVE